jgi:hypothetical protein
MSSRVLLAPLLLTALACASDDPTDRATLKNVKAFCVVVEVSDQSSQGGVDKDKLQADIEGRLQEEGAAIDKNATTCLYLNVRALRAVGGKGKPLPLFGGKDKPLPLYAADLRLEFLQTVALTRDPTVKTYAPTWSSANMTMVPAEDLGHTALEIETGLVDRFVAAYKSVQPH